jgi:mono/diheme cytochrome c family protein
MASDPSNRQIITGARAAGVLVLACMVALGVWWARRAAAERALGAALSGYPAAPFPLTGDPVDEGLADLGADVFRSRCAACHVMNGEEKLGPSLAGVTRRRELTWIRDMILRPDSMTANDPVASALKARYGVQMLVTGELTPAHVRAVVEFLRRADAGDGG